MRSWVGPNPVWPVSLKGEIRTQTCADGGPSEDTRRATYKLRSKASEETKCQHLHFYSLKCEEINSCCLSHQSVTLYDSPRRLIQYTTALSSAYKQGQENHDGVMSRILKNKDLRQLVTEIWVVHLYQEVSLPLSYDVLTEMLIFDPLITLF